MQYWSDIAKKWALTADHAVWVDSLDKETVSHSEEPVLRVDKSMWVFRKLGSNTGKTNIFGVPCHVLKNIPSHAAVLAETGLVPIGRLTSLRDLNECLALCELGVATKSHYITNLPPIHSVDAFCSFVAILLQEKLREGIKFGEVIAPGPCRFLRQRLYRYVRECEETRQQPVPRPSDRYRVKSGVPAARKMVGTANGKNYFRRLRRNETTFLFRPQKDNGLNNITKIPTYLTVDEYLKGWQSSQTSLSPFFASVALNKCAKILFSLSFIYKSAAHRSPASYPKPVYIGQQKRRDLI